MRNLICASLITSVAAAAGATIVAAQPIRLVVDPPPGAVADPLDQNVDANSRVFLSKMPMAAVQQYFAQKTGQQARAGGIPVTGVIGQAGLYNVAVLSGAALAAAWRAANQQIMAQPTAIGVLLEEHPPGPGQPGMMVTARVAMAAPLAGKTPAEVNALKARYAHLDRAYFKHTTPAGGAPGSSTQLEDLSQQCGPRMPTPGQSGADIGRAMWDTSIACLARTDSVAYMTRITIQFHPTSWKP